MFFQSSLQQARNDFDNNILPKDIILANKKKSTLSTNLSTSDPSSHHFLTKTSKLKQAAKTFFDNKDVDKRIKSRSTLPVP